MKLTNLNNVVVEGVTLEFQSGAMAHADFMDDVYPDATCGQWDRGLWVVLVSDDEANGQEYFVSFTDASVWQGTHLIDGARCREVAVMVAVRDAREPYFADMTEVWI